MNEPTVAADKLESLISKAGRKRKLKSGDYAACKVILADLIAWVKESEKDVNGHMKLTGVNQYLDSMFGADIDNGHSINQLVSFALGDLRTAREYLGLNP